MSLNGGMVNDFGEVFLRLLYTVEINKVCSVPFRSEMPLTYRLRFVLFRSIAFRFRCFATIATSERKQNGNGE